MQVVCLSRLDRKVALVEQQPRRPLCVRPEARIAVHVGHGQQAAGLQLTILVVPLTRSAGTSAAPPTACDIKRTENEIYKTKNCVYITREREIGSSLETLMPCGQGLRPARLRHPRCARGWAREGVRTSGV